MGIIISWGPFFPKIRSSVNDGDSLLQLPESVWWSLLMSHLGALEKQVRTNDSYLHWACFWPWPQSGLTMFDCTSPTPVVLGTWTRIFTSSWSAPPAPATNTHTRGEQKHRPRHLVYCHEAEQKSTHGPRTLALLALTSKLSLLLRCFLSGNECLSTYCFQL